MGYTKVFEKIVRSSIWTEDSDTRVAWLTMMVLADKDGIVVGAPRTLANIARVDEEKFMEALEKFMAPDPESTTESFEGRRIEKVEGGYRLLNHAKYRDMMSLEQKREYYRSKKAEYREKERKLSRDTAARKVIKEKVDALERVERIE